MRITCLLGVILIVAGCSRPSSMSPAGMTQAEIDAKVKEGVAKALATEKANITQAEVDAKVREGVAKALATEKARQSPATTSLGRVDWSCATRCRP